MEHRIKWLTNSAFEISYKGQTIITDPSVRFMQYEGLDENSYSKPDFILITHLHWDHISELRSLYSKYSPKILTGQLSKRELVKYLNANQADVFPVFPGLELDFGTVKIKALYNVHRNVGKKLSEQVSSCEESCKKIDSDIYNLQEIGSLEMTNYLITFDDGFTILVWGGDFSVVQENMLRNLNPDVGLFQFSASNFDAYERIIESVNPKTAIAYHHDFRCKKNEWLPQLESFKKICKKNFMILDNEQIVSL